MKGREKEFKCEICGKYIKYKDIENDKVIIEFVPDTHFTIERTIISHKECRNEKESKET